MSSFALPAIVRRQLAGSPHPTLEYLAKEEAGWAWKKERVLAFAFPDYGDLAQGCKLGAQCSEHAGCVARCVGGDAMVIPKGEREELRLIHEMDFSGVTVEVRVVRDGHRDPSLDDFEDRVSRHILGAFPVAVQTLRK